MTPAALYWLFALAITVHNLEEGLFLPAYAGATSRLSGRVTPFAFRFALVVLTAAAYVVVALAVAGSHQATQLLAGLAVVMVVNAVVPHLALTVAFRRYAPGTGTALCIMLPLSLLVIAHGLAADAMSGRSLLIATVVVAVVLIVVIPLLFVAGRFVERYASRLSANGAT
ncbi:HXXEE domain-containing protein [Pleomorphomonas sp. NRK KF1]|uniref:HXXEE domain-containing protein n=1 Tax=Pleomorphomonas sp. NRK KF1 TaxID=2943000 RepID=UPI002044459D|nr:HXXEE domain-containing protein [Pleomorphomonas sp. NRK KF1]MCM5555566.1 HXXEE domain-containing protein [Pleomorphomonas sp. NRK KF1]